MRILLVTQWFTPEPTVIGPSLAQEMARKGHEVDVLTGYPNYPEGRLYEGYRLRALTREVIGGVNVFRVPLYPSHDNSALRRALNYASFAVSAAIIGHVAVRAHDVALVYQGPATIGLPGIVFRALRGVPYVLYIQDLWPDTLSATGMMTNERLLRWVGRWCDFVYRCASRIIVQSPGFKTVLIERGVMPEKVHVVYNWDDEAGLELPGVAPDFSERKTVNWNGFNIVYAGNIGSAQALNAVVDAAGLLNDSYPEIRFVLIGSGTELENLKSQVVERGLSNVTFVGRQPKSRIRMFLEEADALLVHLKNEPLFSITIPSKVQAYLAQGKPLLAGVAGDAADLIMRSGAGVVCRPEDPRSIADGALRLYRMSPEERTKLGVQGRDFYREHLSMQHGVQKVLSVLEAASRSSYRIR